jgi:hypothetical protein
MNRRSILKGIGAALGLAIADPAEALWKPGKLISIPKTVVPMTTVEHFHTFNYDFLMNGNDRALSEAEFARRFYEPGRKYLLETLKQAGLEKAELVSMGVAPGMVYHREIRDGRGRPFRVIAGFNPSQGDYGCIQVQVKTQEFRPREENMALIHSVDQRFAGVIREWKGRV